MIIVITMRLITFSERGYTTDLFFEEDYFIVWTETELAYSIISATIPTIVGVMKDLNTQFGAFDHRTISASEHSHINSSEVYKMSKLKSIGNGDSEVPNRENSAASRLDTPVGSEHRMLVHGADDDASNSQMEAQKTRSASGGEETTSVNSCEQSSVDHWGTYHV